MALGDLLSMLAMPGGPQYPQGPNLANPMAPPAPQGQVPQMALPTASASPQSATQPVGSPSSLPDGSLMPDGPDTIAGHHISNLLNLTGNLTPPQGSTAPTGQTQANLPGGFTPPTPYQTPDPQTDPTGGNPHYYAQHVNGPFKTHGIIGDILGHVMDAALVSAGLKPEYTERSMAAKQADAINGYQNDPTGALMRLAATSGVPAATAFQTGADADVAAHNKVATDQADLLIKANQAKLAQAAAVIKAHQQQANMASPLLGMDPKDPKAIALAKQTAVQINASRANYGEPPLDDDSPEGLQLYAKQSISPEKVQTAQNTKDYHDALIQHDAAMTGIAAQNAGTSSRRADIAASQAASANAYRSWKMNNPGATHNQQNAALKTIYLKNQIKLQQQRAGVTSMYKGVPDEDLEGVDGDDDGTGDDDADTTGGASSVVPAASSGVGKIPAGMKLQVNHKTGATRFVPK